MAYLFEQAGGTATNGIDRILDIVPAGLHARTPLVLGSKRLGGASTAATTGGSLEKSSESSASATRTWVLVLMRSARSAAAW